MSDYQRRGLKKTRLSGQAPFFGWHSRRCDSSQRLSLGFAVRYLHLQHGYRSMHVIAAFFHLGTLELECSENSISRKSLAEFLPNFLGGWYCSSVGRP